jgi:hypothetical protein
MDIYTSDENLSNPYNTWLVGKGWDGWEVTSDGA